MRVESTKDRQTAVDGTGIAVPVRLFQREFVPKTRPAPLWDTGRGDDYAVNRAAGRGFRRTATCSNARWQRPGRPEWRPRSRQRTRLRYLVRRPGECPWGPVLPPGPP